MCSREGFTNPQSKTSEIQRRLAFDNWETSESKRNLFSRWQSIDHQKDWPERPLLGISGHLLIEFPSDVADCCHSAEFLYLLI
jgi:hypothetical protein